MLINVISRIFNSVESVLYLFLVNEIKLLTTSTHVNLLVKNIELTIYRFIGYLVFI